MITRWKPSCHWHYQVESQSSLCHFELVAFFLLKTPFLRITGSPIKVHQTPFLTMQKMPPPPSGEPIPSSPSPLVVLLLVRLGAVPDHLPQLVLLDELAVQDAEVIDQISATLHQSGARGDGTVSLNAEFELTDKGTGCQRKMSGLWDVFAWKSAHLTRGWGTL